MPVRWAFDRHGFAVLTITAPYTFNEWRRAMDDILAAHAGPIRFLVDRRAAGIPTPDFVEEIVDYFRAQGALLGDSVAAIVVGGDAAYGIARMLDIHAGGRRIRMPIKIFLEYEYAVRWLGEVGQSPMRGD
jgi:hypothetical protein